MQGPVTIFYTQNLRGQLDVLPRLATLLNQQRASVTDGLRFVLDMGGSCEASVPVCQVTEGRAALMVLDAIGYDAANGVGVLTAEGWAKLVENPLNMKVVSSDNAYVRDGIALAAEAPPAHPHRIHISLETAPELHLSLSESVPGGYTLRLPTLTGSALGVVRLSVTPEAVSVVDVAQLPVTPHVLANPTIAGVVDFVRSEATYYDKTRRRRDAP